MKEISKAAAAHRAHITAGADLGLLDPVDRDTIDRYAESMARWRELEARVDEYGLLVKQQNGFPAENPYIPIAARYSAASSRMENATKKILAELRTAAPKIPPPAAPGEDDELDRVFSGQPLGIEQEPE
jgi:hypothetical protein